jgi:hypothetical protein
MLDLKPYRFEPGERIILVLALLQVPPELLGDILAPVQLLQTFLLLNLPLLFLYYFHLLLPLPYLLLKVIQEFLLRYGGHGRGIRVPLKLFVGLHLLMILLVLLVLMEHAVYRV